ncbi:hypothetical protein [Actinomadura sp. HBU206391]|uniref:hypothetical protein n=1 Tax=Actinomadura sp. HBU206391 TaxID=2731692 RepID=UPI00164F9F2E|nr:hypothetical protein [Actinomadura sp. HBU206391]MBC6461369.1 hypothetical protein [Actinomadura sp. HBU206391]
MTTLIKRRRSASGETEPEKTDAADEDTPAGSAPARNRGSRLRIAPGTHIAPGTQILAVLVLVAAVLAAAVVSLNAKRNDLRNVDEASRQAVHAASQAARDLSSYDYRTLESDFKTATGQTTGKLRTEYAALAQQIRATAIQQQAISQTTVIKAGAESASARQVTVLVFANRSATTTASPNRLPEPLRMRMTMVKVEDRWLASDLQVL